MIQYRNGCDKGPGNGGRVDSDKYFRKRTNKFHPRMLAKVDAS